MNNFLLVEANRRYTDYMVELLGPQIFMGLTSIYKSAVTTAKETSNQPNLLFIFRKMLTTIPTWNKNKIHSEAERIRGVCGASSILDTLVKSIVETNILILSGSAGGENLIAKSYLEGFTFDDLVHACYVDCGRHAYNNPHLYLCKDYAESISESRRNSTLVQEWINNRIPKTLVSILPIQSLLKELSVNLAAQEEYQVELVPAQRSTSRREKRTPRSATNTALQKEISDMVRQDQDDDEETKMQNILYLHRSMKRSASRADGSASSKGKRTDGKSTKSTNPLFFSVHDATPYETEEPNLGERSVIEEYRI